MKHALLVLLLVACKEKSEKPAETKPAPTKSPTETKRPELPTTATKPLDTDEGFKSATNTLATTHQWVVSAWGTATLDDKGGNRWALLAPDPKTANGSDDKGAYLVQAGEKFYLIEFPYDGKTTPWMGAAEPTTVWKKTTGAFIEHTQGHSGGFVKHQLAIRGGDVVVLRTTEKNRNENEKATSYANLVGECAKPCPKASDDGFFTIKTGKPSDL